MTLKYLVFTLGIGIYDLRTQFDSVFLSYLYIYIYRFTTNIKLQHEYSISILNYNRSEIGLELNECIEKIKTTF